MARQNTGSNARIPPPETWLSSYSCRFPPSAFLSHYGPPLSSLSFSFRPPPFPRGQDARPHRILPLFHPLSKRSPVREAVFSPFLWIPCRSPPTALLQTLIPLCSLWLSVIFQSLENGPFPGELPDWPKSGRVEGGMREGCGWNAGGRVGRKRDVLPCRGRRFRRGSGEKVVSSGRGEAGMMQDTVAKEV